MTTKRELPEKQQFGVRIRTSTIRRIRWYASNDTSQPMRLGETVDYLLVRALDDIGVPPEGEL